MYANGQRSLRIPIFYMNSGENCSGALGTRGTNLNSAGGGLSAQCSQNLASLLQKVASLGFSNVLVGFFGSGANSPQAWPSNWYLNSYYLNLAQENWNLIYNLKPLLDNSGLNYKIDLMNEGIPNYQPGNQGWKNSQMGWLTYVQWLWNNYRSVFGTSQTVGFSVVPGGGGYAQYNLADVYGTTFPPVFDLHFYDYAYATYLNTWSLLSSRGQTEGWVVGETYYNDATNASELWSAHQAAGNTVFWLAQWPLTRARTCSDVDVAPPSLYSNYSANGW